MTRIPPPPTPERNRLRAASALIPIIESGLDDGKLSEDKARQMICFCEWALGSEASELDEIELKATIREGVIRLSARLNSEALISENLP